jgi:hypothetical protein
VVERSIQGLLRWYLLVLGAVLIAQGAGSLARSAIAYNGPWLVNGLLNADPRHAAIHMVWGAVMLGTIALAGNAHRLTGLALVFGVFYVGLAVLGVVVYHPFGLQLNLFENAFHWTVGPLTLGLGVAAGTGRLHRLPTAR